MLYILKLAYQEFESRVGQTTSPRGSKTELVTAAIAAQTGGFTLQDLIKACPGVSQDLIRKTLGKLQQAGELECQGRGPGAMSERLPKAILKLLSFSESPKFVRLRGSASHPTMR